MLRLVAFLLGVAAVASGLSWLADRPGSLLINWQGYEIETSVFRAIVMLALLVGVSILVWSIATTLWRSPASVGAFFNRRRQVRGLEALSSGMIAIGAGDQANAIRHALQARKALPNEPLTHLLRAQAAQLSGDRTTARRMFEAMLATPETEQLGLRGLYLEAEREGEREVAQQLAERSVELNPRLGWAVDALFDLQCKHADWANALKTLAVARRHQHQAKPVIDRRRAVLLTARAQALEDTDPDRAMGLAIEAHHLAHDLIPAAAIAGRLLAARGHTKRAAKIIERTWRRAAHPELGLVYAHARIGDSPHDRLERVRRLAQLNPHSIETPIAIATAAVEAREWETARQVLEPLDAARMTQRVCTLMARIEGEAQGDKGRVREWLARAVHAPRDPAWVADGIVAERWAPLSPLTGAFDAFQWRVPADALDATDLDLLARKRDELMRLGAGAITPAALGSAIGETGVTPTQARQEADRKDAGPSPRIVPTREAEDVEMTATSAQASSRERTRPDVNANGNGTAPESVAQRVAVRGKESTGASEPASKTQASRDRKPLDPSVFIAPRAPDDPGPKSAEGVGERQTASRSAVGQRRV